MEMLAYSGENRTVAIPWFLDPEHEDLDLEVHGCGCGCGCSCGCSCACSCSCSCSCSCDNTGANSDDTGEHGSWGDDGSDDSESAPIGQCAVDIAHNALEESVEELAVAAVIAKIAPVAASAITVGGLLHGAIDGAQESEACQEVFEAAKETIVEGANELANDESFNRASETLLVVH